MDREQFYQTILPYLGGPDNISRQVWRGSKLCVTVKDVGVLRLDALEDIETVAAVELSRGRVTVSAQGLEQEKENNMATDNKQIAKDVLAAVGGKDNVTQVTHCMTRLRFSLRDQSIPDDKKIQNLDGVMGVMRAGGQLQIIIGQNVPKVYEEVCKLSGQAMGAQIKENLDSPKGPLTIKSIFGGILSYVTGSMVPLIPAMMAAALIRTIRILIGPGMLELISAESDFYLLTEIVYNGFFYFLPIFLGAYAAKRLNMDMSLGMLMGGILIAPGLVALVGERATLSVYGLPARVLNYSQTVVPILLSVWVMSYLYKFLKKHLPETITTMFTPFLTMLIMLPVSLCALAPLGNIIGDFVGAALNFVADNGGVLGVALVGGLWQFLVITGMHQVLITASMVNMLQAGQDSCILVGASMARFAIIGIALGAFLRMKSKRRRAENIGHIFTSTIGGISEPILYDLAVRFKRPLIALFCGGFAGGIFGGLTHVTAYVIAGNGIFNVLSFVSPDDPMNFTCGIIAALISMIVSTLITYFFGFGKEELAEFDKD